MKIVAIALGILGALIVFILLIPTGSPPPGEPSSTDAAQESAPPPPTLPELSHTELIDAYEANTIAADLRFKDQRILITGPITDIGEEILGRPYVTLVPEDRLFGVQALFPRDDAVVVAMFSKGQTVRLECEVSGETLGSIIVDDCARR